MALTWTGGYSEIRRTGGASTDNIVSSIEEHRITHVMLVPSLLRELVTRPDLMQRLSDSMLTWIVTGAEPVPRTVIEAVCRGMPGVDVCQGYGLSEFPTICTVLMADEVFDHEGTAGRPLPHTDPSLGRRATRHGVGVTEVGMATAPKLSPAGSTPNTTSSNGACMNAAEMDRVVRTAVGVGDLAVYGGVSPEARRVRWLRSATDLKDPVEPIRDGAAGGVLATGQLPAVLRASSRSLNFWTFPLAVVGNVATKAQRSGTLERLIRAEQNSARTVWSTGS